MIAIGSASSLIYPHVPSAVVTGSAIPGNLAEFRFQTIGESRKHSQDEQATR